MLEARIVSRKDHETARPGAAAAATLGAGPAGSGPRGTGDGVGWRRVRRGHCQAWKCSQTLLGGTRANDSGQARAHSNGRPEGQRPGRWARRTEGRPPSPMHSQDRRPCSGTKDKGRAQASLLTQANTRAGSGFARSPEGRSPRGGSSAPCRGKPVPHPQGASAPQLRRQGNGPHIPPPRQGGRLPSRTGSGTACPAQPGLALSPRTVFILVRRPQPQGQLGHSPARATPRLNSPPTYSASPSGPQPPPSRANSELRGDSSPASLCCSGVRRRRPRAAAPGGAWALVLPRRHSAATARHRECV